MPAICHTDRRLFRLIKINRGQSLDVTTGTEISIASVHWTPDGPRPCSADSDNCPHCTGGKASRPRETIYLAAWETGARSPGLLIISSLTVPWASDTDDLVRCRLTITRARGNNLLRAVHAGPAERPTPPQPLDAWLQTLWGAQR